MLLRRLHRELRYSAGPFDELLKTVQTGDLTALSWLPAWSDKADLTALPTVSEEEKAFAEAFFHGLGITDLEGQLAHIGHAITATEERRQAALETYRRCAKAYAVTGVCVGLGIAITLL